LCAGDLAIVFLNNLSYEEILHQVKTTGPDTAVLYYHLFADSRGTAFVPAQVAEQLCRISAVPVYGAFIQYVGSGVLGGYMQDYEILGKRTGEVAIEVLQGRSPESIPVERCPISGYAADWRELKRWNLDAEKLPAGGKIEFRQYSLWEAYKEYVMAGVLLLLLETLLIVALMIARDKREQAEQALRKLNEDLELRVQERTRQLVTTNELLETEVSEREAAEEELRQHHAELEVRVRERTQEYADVFNPGRKSGRNGKFGCRRRPRN
jgi:hypothetical protein